MARDTRIALSVTEDLMERLRLLARSEGRTVSNYCWHVLNVHVQKVNAQPQIVEGADNNGL